MTDNKIELENDFSVDSIPIPDKLYFKIGEASEIVGVKPYVLRYWETEFREIAPVKSRTNQRLYRRKDVEFLLKIKELLYKERFTIDGAKKRLKEELHEKKETEEPSQLGLGLVAPEEAADAPISSNKIQFIKEELKDLLKSMKDSLKE